MSALSISIPDLLLDPEQLQDQLLMPWGRPHQTVLFAGKILGSLNEFDLVYSLTRQGRRLDLVFNIVKVDDPSRTVVTTTLSLDLGARAICTLGSVATPRWHHTWTLGPEKFVEHGPFSELYASSLGFLVGVGTGEEGRCTRPAAVALRDICRVAERYALDLCDPRALKVARAFYPSVRFEIYSLTVRYGERIAQMAEVCPGLLFLVLALWGRGDGSERSILSSIVDGEGLAKILGNAWREWTSAQVGEGTRAITETRAQLQYLRLAPAAVELSPAALALPRGALVGDIPREANAREAWYRVIAQVAIQSAPMRLLDTAAAKRVTGYFSIHALAMDEAAFQARGSVEAMVGELLDFVVRSGQKVPSRRSDPGRVRRVVGEWHVVSWTYSKYAPYTPLLRSSLGVPSPPLKAAALETVAELLEEGRMMRHCIASYAASAVKGEVFVYRAKFLEERLTVALEVYDGRLFLMEVRGKCNRMASPQATSAIREWIDTHEGAQEFLK